MAHCKNCGRNYALQNATEFGVAPNGASTVLRCKLCDSRSRSTSPLPMETSEPLSIEAARAKTALLQAEMTRLV
jgi:hypothetical protein